MKNKITICVLSFVVYSLFFGLLVAGCDRREKPKPPMIKAVLPQDHVQTGDGPIESFDMRDGVRCYIFNGSRFSCIKVGK